MTDNVVPIDSRISASPNEGHAKDKEDDYW